MFKYISIFSFVFFMLLSSSAHSTHVCVTGKVGKLLPRNGGYVHIVIDGVDNIDLKNCGQGNYYGMLLNYNDTTGTVELKKLMYSSLLTAYSSGKEVTVCATGCDTQIPSYSRLEYLNLE